MEEELVFPDIHINRRELKISLYEMIFSRITSEQQFQQVHSIRTHRFVVGKSTNKYLGNLTVEMRLTKFEILNRELPTDVCDDCRITPTV